MMRAMLSHRLTFWMAAALGAVVPLWGCSETTGVVIVIHSDIGDMLQEVELKASLPGGQSQQARIAVSGRDFPLSQALAFDSDNLSSLNVEAVGFRNGQPVIRDIAQTQFVTGSIREVSLQFWEPCLGVRCSNDMHRCIPGSEAGCGDAEVAGPALPLWTGAVTAPPAYCPDIAQTAGPMLQAYTLDNHCGACGAPLPIRSVLRR